MTKEEILREEFRPESEDCRTYREDLLIAITHNPSLEKIEKCMDEYAKAQGIAFADWIRNNYWNYNRVGNFYFKWQINGPEIRHSTEELYNLFISEDKTKQP